MKIIAIRIKNLASLEGISEIDFTAEPLKSSGIFAITGPTGAGKSTILDALCLALYAKTPRYVQAKEIGVDVQDVAGTKIGQGDIRGILRDGTADGYAEVEFVGVDEQVYRATWSVRRARDKAEGSLQADTVQLRNSATNIIFGGRKTETLKETERLVGLNFEQFTRSVLLAQGDFTAFLKADKDSKSSLLEKLTGTTIYSEISRLIFEKYRSADQDVKDLQRQLEGITVLSQEDLALLHNQRAALEIEIASTELKAAGITDGINWYKTLAELLEGKATTEAEWKLAKANKEQAIERSVTLQKVESVQQIKGQFEARANTQLQLNIKKNELDELTAHLHDLKIKSDKLSIELKQAEEAETAQKKQIITAQPSIDKAKETDTLLKEKKQQLDSAGFEAEQAEEQERQHTVAVTEQLSEIATLSKTIEELQIWKTENDPREPIAVNISLILSKLSDAQKLVSLRKTTNEQIEEAATASQNSIIEKQKAEVQIAKGQLELTQANTDYNSLQSELAAIPIDELKSQGTTLVQLIQEVVTAKAHWEILYHSEKDYNLLNALLDSNRKELNVLKVAILAKTDQLAVAKAAKETTERLLSRAQLQAAENVETLRSSLVEDEECPVCGSTTHPYVLKNPQLERVLEGLKEESRKCNEIYETLLKEYSAEEQLIRSLEITIIQQQDDIEVKSEKLKLLRSKWLDYKVAQESDVIINTEKAEWLVLEESRLKKELAAIQSQIDIYGKIKQKLDSYKENIGLLEKTLALSNEFLKDAEHRWQKFTDEVTRLQLQSDKSKADIDAIINHLNPYFSKADWAQYWQQNPIQFEQNISDFSVLWNQKMETLDKNINNVTILQTTLEALQRQSVIVSKNSKDKLAKRNEIQGSFISLQEQRKLLFDGENIADVEHRLAQKLEAASQLYKNLKLQQDELIGMQLKAQTNSEQLTKDTKQFEETIENYAHQIANWTAVYNSKNESAIDEHILAKLLLYTHEWIESERKALKIIDDVLITAVAAYGQRVNLVNEHEQKRTTDLLLPELTTIQLALKAGLDKAVREKEEINFRLRQDEENQGSITLRQEEINTKRGIHDNWAKLNELLGSADGKKFRQIAQEYTLDVLLGYANVHLQLLTSRYKLARIPGTLGLQIFDKDMGDEVRTVFSLSGGESFLVSLALALGLASLSSNKMKVESLFIDEGFGSLDPETLSVAMDALERLHNQGRKVGVISHVQEMTERIPVQIKVSKLSNGKSRIEVRG